MKIFGSYKPTDKLISEEHLGSIYLKIERLSDLDEHPFQKIAIFTKRDPVSGFNRGDIVENVDGVWQKASFESQNKLGKPTNLRGYRIGSCAYIRWHDPIPVRNLAGDLILDWTKSVLVKKNGSAPSSVMDGTVVVTTTKRDIYNAPGTMAFNDHCPDIDGSNSMIYRVFAYGSDGSITASDPITFPQLTWSIIQTEIRNGNAATIFSPGDTFTLRDGNEIVVASIDTAKAPTQLQATYPHLVTFLFKYGFNSISFDAASSTGFKRTKDTYVLSRKTYYVLQGGSFVRISPIVGSKITNTPPVYEALSNYRADAGSNNWSSSDIRAWANAISLNDVADIIPEWITQNGITTTPYQYLLDNDPGEVGWTKLANCIAQTSCKTSLSGIDGRGSSTTSNMFFVPSITEIMGSGASDLDEGTQFQLYREGYIDEIGLSYLDAGGNALSMLTRTNLMTRSPYSVSGDRGTDIQVLHDGEVIHQTAVTKTGCILAFSIG